MPHPSTYYLKFLLAKSYKEETDESSETLNDTLLAYGLPSLAEHDYNLLREAFKPPKSFRFNNKKHRETAVFLKKEKVYTLWSPKTDDKRVLSEIVDGHRLLKLDIHILLMGQIPNNIIADKVNKKYRVVKPLTERMIATYAHYFWNVRMTSQKEWEDTLRGSPHYDALMSSLYCGDQQALYRAGFSPQVDGKRTLNEAMRQVHFRIQALRHQPDSKATIDTFSKLSARAMNLYNVLYSEGVGLTDQLREFRSVLMKHKDPDVKKIDDLIDKIKGGSYSGDGEDKDTLPSEGDLQ
jgi:hypothetical protein